MKGVAVAWVTGASSGIGRAVALELARSGVVVAATARREDELASLAAEAAGFGGRVAAYPGDLSDPESLTPLAARIAAELGTIDLAVLNAGLFIPVRAVPFDADAFYKTCDVNLKGTVGCLAAVLPAMTARRGGKIVLVASVTGYAGLPSSAAYGATKAALNNLAESLKFDLDRVGVAIQVVNPGFVDTPATKQNDFRMPALLAVDDAAKRIVAGIERGGFEITFPKRFTYVLKVLKLLPYPAYFWLVTKATGWDKKTD
ncbi:NAD(P)-dependent dehydrogenase (short-subunit alcohol dehydrogenase family) [Methylopila capsulata]|uniref:NAD(P)-dependent dehydrogenase (Short-subunit alcohol dehydrogenase family) n=1 Tax=Methylopila capsulata TaxID=61654 RepID=A0A9W6MTA2_9HYPH|nr:SDR family NAD(P)-dependent oxidoreductase [Methylopila capsulata]MBM7853191.1 NAD(P)-dependent dehydrogenase (short-subunit alcohol dehydrogenase family) [Methylopila capsulata]GLK57595.1 oxidoreductase [Methylopila capsulata]